MHESTLESRVFTKGKYLGASVVSLESKSSRRIRSFGSSSLTVWIPKWVSSTPARTSFSKILRTPFCQNRPGGEWQYGGESEVVFGLGLSGAHIDNDVMFLIFSMSMGNSLELHQSKENAFTSGNMSKNSSY